MTLLTHLFIGSVFNISRFETAWVRTGPVAAGVALETDIPFGVTGLARLQVPASLCGMLAE